MHWVSVAYSHGVGEDSWQSLGLQGDLTSQSQRKSVLNIHWRNYFEAETSVLWPPDAKNWCFQAVVLEKILDSPLDCKEIKPVNPTGNQSWTFIGKTDAEVPVLWPPDAKNWLTGKDPGAGKDWRQEGKGTTENKMVECHHQLDGHEFEQAPGVGDGQESLACCSPWGWKESDRTEQLSWTELNWPPPLPRDR